VGTIIPFTHNLFAPASGGAVAALRKDTHDAISATTDPIVSSGASDSEYGWGPVRLVDW